MATSLRDQAPNKSNSEAACAGLVIDISTVPVGSDHQADVIRVIRAGQRDLSGPSSLQGSAQELRNGKSDGQGDVERNAFSPQLLKVYQKARIHSGQQFTSLTRKPLKIGPEVNGIVVRTLVSAVLGKGDRANQHDSVPEARPFRSIGGEPDQIDIFLPVDVRILREMIRPFRAAKPRPYECVDFRTGQDIHRVAVGWDCDVKRMIMRRN